MNRPSNSPVSSVSSKGSSLRSPLLGLPTLKMAVLPMYFLMVSRGPFMMDADPEREGETRGASEEPEPRPPNPLSLDAAFPLLFPMVLQRTMNCSLPPPDAVVGPAINHVNVVPMPEAPWANPQHRPLSILSDSISSLTLPNIGTRPHTTGAVQSAAT